MQTEYYIGRLNSHKKTGFIFNYLPVPSGIPFLFLASTVIVFAMIQVAIPLFFISLIPAILIAWKLKIVSDYREKVLEDCITEESYLNMILGDEDLKEIYPGDPTYVVDSDRRDIFDTSIHRVIKDGFIPKQKSHYVYLISVVASYFALVLFMQSIVG